MKSKLSDAYHYFKGKEEETMSERYLITGAQLGMIAALIKNKEYDRVIQEFDNVFNDQFLGHSDNPIKFDAEKLSELFRPKK